MLVISQDITLNKRKENIPGTEQYVLMQNEMKKIYSIVHEKYECSDYQDCSKLIYTMTQDTSIKWTDRKAALISRFD